MDQEKVKCSLLCRMEGLQGLLLSLQPAEHLRPPASALTQEPPTTPGLQPSTTLPLPRLGVLVL